VWDHPGLLFCFVEIQIYIEAAILAFTKQLCDVISVKIL